MASPLEGSSIGEGNVVKQEFDIKQERQDGFDSALMAPPMQSGGECMFTVVKEETDITEEEETKNMAVKEEINIKDEFDYRVKSEPVDDNEFEEQSGLGGGCSDTLVTVTPEKGLQHVAWEVVEEVHLGQASETGTCEVSPTSTSCAGMRNDPGAVNPLSLRVPATQLRGGCSVAKRVSHLSPLTRSALLSKLRCGAKRVEMEAVEDIEIKTEVEEEEDAGCGVGSVCEGEEASGLRISGVVSGEAEVQAMTGELACQGSARRTRKRKTDREAGSGPRPSQSSKRHVPENRGMRLSDSPAAPPCESESVLASTSTGQSADDGSITTTTGLQFQIGKSRGTSSAAGDGHKPEKKAWETSENHVYPHCQCEVPDGEGRPEEQGLEHVGVIWIMKQRIFSFASSGKIFMFLMEFNMTNILPRLGLVDNVLFGLTLSQGDEVRTCSSQEWKFMSRVYEDWEATLNTNLMVTPLVMHLIYSSAEKCSGQSQWTPFARTMFYQQRYGHVCPWTTLITPLATRDNLPDLGSMPNKNQRLVKGARIPRILARLRKQSTQQAVRCLSTADSAGVVSQALEQLLAMFCPKGLVELFCSCPLTLDDLATPYEVGGVRHFQVMRLFFMGSRSLYCWLRPTGFFVSVQELKVLGLLPWKQLMVEDMLLAAHSDNDRVNLSFIETSFLRPVAKSMTGEISTALVSLKYLRLIYRCLANFDALWEPFPSAKFYLKVREHNCPPSNINPGVQATQLRVQGVSGVELGATTQDASTVNRAGCDSSADSEASSDSSTPNRLNSGKKPDVILPGKRRRKENPQSVGRTTALSPKTTAATAVGTSTGGAVDSIVKKTSGPDEPRALVILPGPSVAEDKKPPEPYRLADFPRACGCIRESAVFPYFSILACAPTARHCDVMPINRHMGQAVIVRKPAFVALYTFTADDRLYFSVGELTVKGLLQRDLDFDTIPSYGPSSWLRRGEDLELRCLRVRKVNLKVTAFSQYVISAELLCHLTTLRAASDFGSVTLADICLLPIGHVCDDPTSLAFKMQPALKPYLGVDDIYIMHAWAREEASGDVMDPCPVIWPGDLQGKGINEAEKKASSSSSVSDCVGAALMRESGKKSAADGKRDGGSTASAPPISSALCDKTENSESDKSYPSDLSVRGSKDSKLQIALRILKGVANVGNLNLRALKSSHTDYFLAEAGGSLPGLIEKVQKCAEKARVAAGEEPPVMLQNAGLTDPEAIAKLLPMYEGTCVRKRRVLSGYSSVTSSAEPQVICLETLQSSLGDQVSDYWIVLTGVLNYNGESFTTMFVDNKLYINWTEFAGKAGFSTEVVYQLACTLRIYVYRPPPAVRQHLLKFQLIHHYDSPWVTVKSLRTVYFLGFENAQFKSYPKTFNYLKSRFVEHRPMGTFRDFILIKKKMDKLPLASTLITDSRHLVHTSRKKKK